MFKKSSRIAKLDGKQADDEMSDQNDRLSKSIQAVGESVVGKEKAEAHYYDSLDWWPNHTRYIEAGFDGFTQEYYDKLRELLTGEFEGWRIQVVVYADIKDGRTMFGSAVIWRDRVLIDRALWAAVRWRGFNFRYEGHVIYASPSEPYDIKP